MNCRLTSRKTSGDAVSDSHKKIAINGDQEMGTMDLLIAQALIRATYFMPWYQTAFSPDTYFSNVTIRD